MSGSKLPASGTNGCRILLASASSTTLTMYGVYGRAVPLMPTTLTLNAESSSNWHHRPHISISTSPQSERPLKRLSDSRYPGRRDRGHFSSTGGSCHEEEESLFPSDGVAFSIVARQRVDYRAGPEFWSDGSEGDE